jgi:hypothetical protein
LKTTGLFPLFCEIAWEAKRIKGLFPLLLASPEAMQRSNSMDLKNRVHFDVSMLNTLAGLEKPRLPPRLSPKHTGWI